MNNAGNAGTKSYTLNLFHESPRDEWDRFVGVNFFGPMNCVHACTPHMISAMWGRIITVISDAGRRGEPRLAVYAASKAGAAGSPEPSPGNSAIPDHRQQCRSRDNQHLRSARSAPSRASNGRSLGERLRPYIIRRSGEPEDPAAMITFLASPPTSWITGQTYPVNGGYTVNQ